MQGNERTDIHAGPRMRHVQSQVGTQRNLDVGKADTADRIAARHRVAEPGSPPWAGERAGRARRSDRTGSSGMYFESGGSRFAEIHSSSLSSSARLTGAQSSGLGGMVQLAGVGPPRATLPRCRRRVPPAAPDARRCPRRPCGRATRGSNRSPSSSSRRTSSATLRPAP